MPIMPTIHYWLSKNSSKHHSNPYTNLRISGKYVSSNSIPMETLKRPKTVQAGHSHANTVPDNVKEISLKLVLLNSMITILRVFLSLSASKPTPLTGLLEDRDVQASLDWTGVEFKLVQLRLKGNNGNTKWQLQLII
jgi:hypothetical protein